MGLKDLGVNLRISQRPLDVIYLIDVSGSMEGAKIQSVNNAMHELESSLREEAKKNPTAQVNVRIMTFGDTSAKWHIGTKTPVEQFKYKDINNVYGGTPLGSALALLNDSLDSTHMPNRSLRPIIVLLSDGWPTDHYENNLKKLLSLPWGKKAIKVAIAIGHDADKELLATFTTDPNLVLNASNATELRNFIKWTSTLVTHVSKHESEGDSKGGRKAVSIKTPPTCLHDDDDM